MTNEAQLKALAEATDGELYDADYEGGTWMVEAVQTQETIENFIEASAKWAECSNDETRGTLAGMPFVSWGRVQVRKGDQRRSLTVIDFGDVRFALRADASDYI